MPEGPEGKEANPRLNVNPTTCSFRVSWLVPGYSVPSLFLVLCAKQTIGLSSCDEAWQLLIDCRMGHENDDTSTPPWEAASRSRQLPEGMGWENRPRLRRDRLLLEGRNIRAMREVDTRDTEVIADQLD